MPTNNTASGHDAAKAMRTRVAVSMTRAVILIRLSRSAADMLDTVGEGQILLADRAYDSDALGAAMTNRGAWANIKPMPRRVNVPAFSPWLYR
jgi:hypothetical protein